MAEDAGARLAAAALLRRTLVALVDVVLRGLLAVDEADDLALRLDVVRARVVEKVGVNVIEVSALRHGVSVVIRILWNVALASAAALKT